MNLIQQLADMDWRNNVEDSYDGYSKAEYGVLVWVNKSRHVS